MTDEQVATVAVFAAGLVTAGMVLSIVALKAAVEEVKIAQKIGNGRYLFARATLRAQTLRAAGLAALGAIAGLVLFDVPDRRLWVVLLFMTTIGATVIDAALDHLTSKRLTRHFTNLHNLTPDADLEEDSDGNG